MTALVASDAPAQATDRHASPRGVYAVRGALALLWAVGFAVVSGSLDAASIAFLVGYPVIDVTASLIDARAGRGTSTGNVQLVNAGLSLLAVIALALASADSTAAALHVFGAWATVSGLLQLTVALRRRTLGGQWAMILSGSISTLAGAAFNVMAAADKPTLGGLTGYAVLGGLFFIVSAVRSPRP
ncbi:membrane protein [Acidothermaceae bacterium B102]|nr:membrane protein [Acidothermaceae bacterium B102]